MFNHRERILRLEHENKKLKEQKLGEQEEQVHYLHCESIFLNIIPLVAERFRNHGNGSRDL